MESVISVIQHSASINNAFISTVDHLPCDVIRSLWLMQSCNIASNTFKTALDHLMQQIQKDPVQCRKNPETISKLIYLKEKIRNMDSEALQESRALYNQLVTHRTSLVEELNQLMSLGSVSRSENGDSSNELEKVEKIEEEKFSSEITAENLKQQLLDHYNHNPLKSQVEALKEQEEHKKELAAAAITAQEHLHLKSKKKSKAFQNSSTRPKVKLILKIPQKGKDAKSRLKKQELTQEMSKSKHSKHPAQKPKPQPEPEPEPEVLVEPEDTNLYCFCKQPSSGDMIGCDNEYSCPNGDWFHYKCVGLLSKVEALKYSSGKEKWFCSDGCRQIFQDRQSRKKKKKSKRW
ncbi:hypothetical protein CLIB1423_09S00826 [[Candida] railenensis]|uniref:Zinc finger PHD-type domain-containing protein n=1 Tax=[Candida] railenensis TaxID=45579 RepID=A0A9P0QRE1_9ASCO|nr:hypothetical protein CLIB1423_09S00826 [[Candida] railenensis]